MKRFIIIFTTVLVLHFAGAATVRFVREEHYYRDYRTSIPYIMADIESERTLLGGPVFEDRVRGCQIQERQYGTAANNIARELIARNYPGNDTIATWDVAPIGALSCTKVWQHSYYDYYRIQIHKYSDADTFISVQVPSKSDGGQVVEFFFPEDRYFFATYSWLTERGYRCSVEGNKLGLILDFAAEA